MSDVASRVKKLILEYLDVEDAKVTDGARFAEDLGADEINMVELAMAFEEEFGCEVSDEDLPKLPTVKDMIGFVEAKRKT